MPDVDGCGNQHDTWLFTFLLGLQPVLSRKKSIGDSSGSTSTYFVPSDSTLEAQTVVPVEAKPLQSITVRYVLCQDLYDSNVNEKWIRDLKPQKDTLSLLYQIIARENYVRTDMRLELFSHEGYPLNANQYTIDCKFYGW